jgi:hypothetical protein
MVEMINMELKIQILDYTKIGDVECTRPLVEFSESEIPNIMERIDWFSCFTNESGEGWVEICEYHFEKFIEDCEYDTAINWTKEEMKFISIINEELARDKYGFVRLNIY